MIRWLDDNTIEADYQLKGEIGATHGGRRPKEDNCGEGYSAKEWRCTVTGEIEMDLVVGPEG